MDARSQLKVIEAGFLILRKQDEPVPMLKYKDYNQHGWATYMKFETKAARDKQLKFLLESDLYIED